MPKYGVEYLVYIGELRDSIGTFNSLKRLSLYGCQFSSFITYFIGNLTQIRKFLFWVNLYSLTFKFYLIAMVLKGNVRFETEFIYNFWIFFYCCWNRFELCWNGAQGKNKRRRFWFVALTQYVRPAKLLLSCLTLKKSARFGVSILSLNINFVIRLILCSILIRWKRVKWI